MHVSSDAKKKKKSPDAKKQRIANKHGRDLLLLGTPTHLYLARSVCCAEPSDPSSVFTATLAQSRLQNTTFKVLCFYHGIQMLQKNGVNNGSKMCPIINAV